MSRTLIKGARVIDPAAKLDARRDILIKELPFPDVQPGELVAVPVSGAYQLSMASNYNAALRSAVLWLDSKTQSAQSIQRRETKDDLLQRDHLLTKDS